MATAESESREAPRGRERCFAVGGPALRAEEVCYTVRAGETGPRTEIARCARGGGLRPHGVGSNMRAWGETTMYM